MCGPPRLAAGARHGLARDGGMGVALVLIVVALLCAPGVVVGQALWEQAAVASATMERWDYSEARTLLGAMEQEARDAAPTRFVRGKLAYHEGRYAEALVDLEAAAEATPEVSAVVTLRDLVASTAEVVEDYATHVTADGLFEIRYDAERDSVLIPWAEETLEAAYYEIGYDLGYWPEPPIRVEIYPRSSTLAAVSSLTEEAIETSGTIALCKYNKLMFTSPRATLRGYGWRTTLAHEYVHYVVGHRVQEDLPIWFHEALAKWYEGRWTGERAMTLAPSREELLSERIEAGSLITFEQMHPSMAYLPSPEDASTAYSQVFTIVEYLLDRRGPAVVRDILDEAAARGDIVEAFAAALDEPFETFEGNWMRYLEGRPRTVIPGQFREEMQLRAEDADDEASDAFAGIEAVEAEEFLRLGELLRARGYVAAAVEEYEKAELLLGDANPLLQNALARAYLDLGDPAEALAALEQVVGWHPGFYRSHLHRAQALAALARYEEAVRAFTDAGGINPFDPDVHRGLAAAHEALGDTEAAERYRAFARAVGG